MASGKKRRKVVKADHKKQAPATGPFRHPDGDRRRRGGPNVDQAIRDKELLRTQIGAVDLASEDDDYEDEDEA